MFLNMKLKLNKIKVLFENGYSLLCMSIMLQLFTSLKKSLNWQVGMPWQTFYKDVLTSHFKSNTEILSDLFTLEDTSGEGEKTQH